MQIHVESDEQPLWGQSVVAAAPWEKGGGGWEAPGSWRRRTLGWVIFVLSFCGRALRDDAVPLADIGGGRPSGGRAAARPSSDNADRFPLCA
eukprot:gene38205-8119_t